MKSCLECIPCAFDQALRTGKIATDDRETIKRLLDEIGMMIKDISLEITPPEFGKHIYAKVREVTGVYDPYKQIKKDSTEKALKLYPFLKGEVEKSEDRLFTAIRLAIAGNVIDMGINKTFHIEEEIDKALNGELAICDYDKFRERFDEVDEVLYLGDNSGESVFDRVLIEELGKPVTYVVRGIPIINDVIYEDAVQAGIDKVATIISSGTSAPGTVLGLCTDEFKAVYRKAEFVISKGQGNYEALSEEKRPIFFLLKAKCRVIADDIGVNEGDIMLKAAKI